MFARVYALLLTAGLLLAVGACAAAPAAAPSAKPSAPAAAPAPSGQASAGGSVKLAVISPLTGGSAQYGQQGVEGNKFAVEEVNAAGGVLGKKIELVIEDTASDKAQMVALVRRYGAQPDVLAIVGGSSTGELIPSSEAAAELKIPLLSTSSAGVWPKEFNDWTFRDTVVSDRAIPAFLKELYDKMKVQKLAVIYDSDNDFNAIETDFVKKEAPKLGVSILAVEAHRGRDADFSSQLTRMMSQNPDAILIESRTNEAAGIIQQARQRGFKGYLLGSQTLGDPTVFKLAGDAVDGVLIYQSVNPDREKFKEVEERWKKTHEGKSMSKEHAQAYDGLYLIVDAMKRANSTTDRQKVRDALGATKGFVGVIGDYTYAGKGDNTTQRVFLYRMLKSGTYEFVK